MTKYSNSSFWYDFDEDNNVDILTGQEIKPGKDYVKMAATKRAIGNFVRIVTGENIPVTYTIVTPENFQTEIITMNTNTKNWNNDDLLDLYLKNERKSNPYDYFDMPYHMFNHARKYKIHFMNLIELAYSSRKKEHTIAFKKGNFFIQDKETFKENVNFLVKAMNQHKVCKHRMTQLVLCKYLLNKNFDKKTFLDKLEKFPDKLVPSSTMDQALLNVKDLHNYFNKKTKLILTFLDAITWRTAAAL